MTETRTFRLSPVAQKFILHWGEMGTRWGINRTVAQVHALLYLSPLPLDAEAIAKTLSVARSNVSTSLRELLGWRIVRVAPALGDRRQRFETMTDVWEMFRIILEERKKREIDPTVAVLRECVAQAGKDNPAAAYEWERIEQMLDFITAGSALYDEFRKLPPGAIRGLAKLRGRMKKLF